MQESGKDPVRISDERELAAAARAGNEQAFADLVRRHAGRLHRTVARMLCEDAEAWDVVQMAFVRAWKRLDRYDPRWSFATWLYRIATNLAIDLIRARTSREKAHQAEAEHRLRLVEVGEPASTRADVNEMQRVLNELADSLTPKQRGAFILREIEGMDTDEVAAVLDCSPTTVRNHVCQARKVLRREMTRRFPEYLPQPLRS